MNNIIQTKKGVANHVEIMLSFAIFIGFLLFMLIFLKPAKVFSASSSSLEVIESKIIENVSSTIESFSIIINSSVNIAGASCFKIPLTLNTNVIAKDENEKLVNMTHETQSYLDNSGRVYYLYSSSDLQETPSSTSGCLEINWEDYTIGARKEYEFISSIRLKTIIDKYNSDYTALKDELGIKKDFHILVLDKDGVLPDFRIEKTPPEGIEVFSKNIPSQMIEANGDLKQITLSIRAW